jgi:hypothetical protein
MERKNYIRLFLLALAVFISVAYYSNTQLKRTTNLECSEDEKSEQKQSPSEFMIWETLSRNLETNP